ncbi:MAG: lysozyme inhibitor LprI family protein [Clostridium sp.]|nr:lysozyme inhibitor LprI family protein [Clostridium sp.]
MKKILCMLLIITNTIILCSCARLKIEDDDSSVESVESTSSTSSSSSSSSDDSAKADDKTSQNEDKASSSDNKNTPNINININNGTGGSSANSVQYASTKQYYLQKLDGIEAGMSDLDGLRAGSNAQMKQAAGIEYRRWDDVLNEIYSVLKGQLSSSAMSSLEGEELDWIKYKENEAKRCSDAFRGGSAESLVYTSKLAELTKERCYYLVNNYMS